MLSVGTAGIDAYADFLSGLVEEPMPCDVPHDGIAGQRDVTDSGKQRSLRMVFRPEVR